jgi:hypothetical protein
MHQNLYLHRRVLHGALVMLERSAAKVARCVLRGKGAARLLTYPAPASRGQLTVMQRQQNNPDL